MTAMTDAQLDRIAHQRFLKFSDAMARNDSAGIVEYLTSTPAGEVRGTVWISDIKAEVALFYDLDPSHLDGLQKHRHVTRARHVAIYLSRELTGRSFPQLGRAFGGRDCSTVISAVKRIAQLRTVDPELDAQIDTLTALLGGPRQ